MDVALFIRNTPALGFLKIKKISDSADVKEEIEKGYEKFARLIRFFPQTQMMIHGIDFMYGEDSDDTHLGDFIPDFDPDEKNNLQTDNSPLAEALLQIHSLK
jgi:hypothetical protein